jgi:hypothetical protein
VVSRHGSPDCIELGEPFVCLHAVENALLEVVKHADLHSMEEVRLREVPHNTENVSNHVKSLVNMARSQFSIGCLRVGIAERSI